MSSIGEKYKVVSEYCNEQQKCPRFGSGKCELEDFCREPVIVRRNFTTFSVLPDILGMDLDVAYEMITGKY
jgi:hypothetical protein